MSTKLIGDRGEAVAASYLENLGYMIMERNYRFQKNEVDLVCFLPNEQYELGGQLVFVEVKTRTGLGFGHPEDAIDEPKKKRVLRAAEAYLHERKLEGSPSRFDVISVILNQDQEPDIKHFEDAFWIF